MQLPNNVFHEVHPIVKGHMTVYKHVKNLSNDVLVSIQGLVPGSLGIKIIFVVVASFYGVNIPIMLISSY